MKAQRILLPVDFSDHSKACLDWAAALFSDDPDCVFELVFVLEISDGYTLVEGDPRQAVYEALETLAVNFESHHGRAAQRQVLTGYPPTAICSHAQDEGFDMIVMATRGRTGIKHLLLGSTTEKVVRHSSVPVLTRHFDL